MGKLMEKIRIIWAIGSKDLIDAFKNRTTLGLVLSALAFLILFRFMPQLESADVQPRLAVYDQGASRWITRWEIESDFDVIRLESREAMVRYVGNKNFVVLGLILPENFDQIIENGEIPDLQGYIVHWVSEANADEAKIFFEAKLSGIINQTLSVSTDTVYTRADSRGFAWGSGIAVLVALMMSGMFVIPHLMVEEKQTRTMDSLMVSPVTYAELVAGKAFAGGVLAGIVGAIGFAVNSILVNQWWVAAIATVSGALFVVALGLLIGSAVESKQQMSLWSLPIMIVVLAPAFLTTLELLLKDEIRALLRWTPSLALMNLVRASFAEQASLQSIGLDLGVVLGWTMALYALFWLILRREE